jgi:ATP-dependent protease ClpP protease subunit
MTPEEAMAYGIIDDIIAPRSGLSSSATENGHLA